jgi:hypothetical protein
LKALVLFLLLPAAALAQGTPPAPVQDWSNVETVVVTAPKPGPALWHIAQSGSDVWVLGVVTPMPRGLNWNSAAVEDIVAGANKVYLQPQLTAGILETTWFLLTGLHKLKLQDGQTLLGALPPDLRARYAAWLVKLGKDTDTDSEFLPAIAALDLESMFRNSANLEEEADKRVAKIADKAGVPAKPVATYQAMPIADEIGALSAENESACMKDALDDIDVQSVHADAAARAWAVGDLAGVKANYSEAKLYDCFAQTKTFASVTSRAAADSLNAVHEALATPGKSLIVMSMGALLRKDGLLDRLKAQNISVEGPPE